MNPPSQTPGAVAMRRLRAKRRDPGAPAGLQRFQFMRLVVREEPAAGGGVWIRRAWEGRVTVHGRPMTFSRSCRIHGERGAYLWVMERVGDWLFLAGHDFEEVQAWVAAARAVAPAWLDQHGRTR